MTTIVITDSKKKDSPTCEKRQFYSIYSALLYFFPSYYYFYTILVTYVVCIIYHLEYFWYSTKAADICLCLGYFFTHPVPHFHFTY